MPASSVTVAQLSDIHLGPLPSIPPRLINIKRMAGFLNWHWARRFIHLPATAARIAEDVVALAPTHIAVTGDLTNLGLPSEVARAAVWLQRLGPPERISVIPGNHDIYATFAGRKLGTASLSLWKAYLACDTEGARYGDGSQFPFVRILRHGQTSVALIGLNSAIETAPMVATGVLGLEQLGRLARILDATRADGLVRVVMLHHPPQPPGAKAHHELTDAAALADVLRAHGAELVIHGHNHKRSIVPFDGAQGRFAIVGVPSASVGVHSRRGDDLARAHMFQITSNPADGAPRITLIARGLAVPNGPVVELERRSLDRDSL